MVSQIKDHDEFGGVVPEVAARSHLKTLVPLVESCLLEANCEFKDLSAIAATSGPGLIGGVMVGVMVAKSLAMVHQKPFLAVNHLAGHALMPRMLIEGTSSSKETSSQISNLEFPYLMLLVSGGHCQIVIVKSPQSYEILGTTQDDAVGECFDKCAKMIGLPYPGGPNIEKYAKNGDPKAYAFPRPLKGHKNKDLKCQFSFSGLKSAVRRAIELDYQNNNHAPLTEPAKQNICASLQRAISETLVDRMQNALSHCHDHEIPLTGIVVSGGVAANVCIRQDLETLAAKNKLPFYAPPLNLCTDNGVMIAWAGLEGFMTGQRNDLSFKPRPRWPLDEIDQTYNTLETKSPNTTC